MRRVTEVKPDWLLEIAPYIYGKDQTKGLAVKERKPLGVRSDASGRTQMVNSSHDFSVRNSNLIILFIKQ